MNKYMNIKIIPFILFLSVFIVGCSTNPIPENIHGKNLMQKYLRPVISNGIPNFLFLKVKIL